MTDDNEAIRRYHDLRNPLAAGLFRKKPEITVKEPEEKAPVVPEDNRKEAFASNPFMRGFQEKTALSQYFEEPTEEKLDEKKDLPPWLKKGKKDKDDDKSSDNTKDGDKSSDDDDGDDDDKSSSKKDKKDGGSKKGDGDKKVIINVKEIASLDEPRPVDVEMLDEVRDIAGDVWKHVKNVMRAPNHPHFVKAPYGKKQDQISSPAPATHVWHNTRTGEAHEGHMHVHADGTCSTCHHNDPAPRVYHITHYVKAAAKAFQHPGVV